MLDSLFTWSVLSLIGLGVFHGMNPGMGWLFAVAIGIQERSMRSVLVSLGPIALGHALSIAVVVGSVWLLGIFLPTAWLLTVSGLILISFGVYKIASRFRHPKWVGMRVSKPELALWSFIMATAHGAGLMLIPLILRLRDDSAPGAMAQESHAQHMHHEPAAGEPLAVAVTTIGVHSAAMVLTAMILAVLVYQVVGVGILRKAWINLDGIWAGTMLFTGGFTFARGFHQLVVG